MIPVLPDPVSSNSLDCRGWEGRVGNRREVVVMTSSVSTATHTAPPLHWCTSHSLPTTYIQQRIKTRGHDGGHGDWALCWHVGKTSSFSCTDNMCVCVGGGGGGCRAPATRCTCSHMYQHSLFNVRTHYGMYTNWSYAEDIVLFRGFRLH